LRQLTVAENGVRIDSKSQLKFVLVANVSDWRVTIYRTDDKTALEGKAITHVYVTSWMKKNSQEENCAVNGRI
jgi:hypothetical protein